MCSKLRIIFPYCKISLIIGIALMCFSSKLLKNLSHYTFVFLHGNVYLLSYISKTYQHQHHYKVQANIFSSPSILIPFWYKTTSTEIQLEMISIDISRVSHKESSNILNKQWDSIFLFLVRNNSHVSKLS